MDFLFFITIRRKRRKTGDAVKRLNFRDRRNGALQNPMAIKEDLLKEKRAKEISATMQII